MREWADGLLSEGGLLAGWSAIPAYALVMVVSCILVIAFIAVFAMFAIWLERKVAGRIQSRYGPIRTGVKFGWLQSIADTVKLLIKEDIIPAGADRFLFVLSPFLVFIGALAAFVVLPFGRHLIVSDLNIGIFYILAISSIVVPGILLAGWASNNKWSLYGAMRSAAQMVAFEIPVGLSLIAVVLLAGSLSMQQIVGAQDGGFWMWFVFRTPFTLLGFFLYFVASLAEVNRLPFDMPEAESELVAGYHTEYSGMRFAIFFLGEYANMFVVAAIGATAFLGGWHSPIPGNPILPGWLWFLAKSIFLVFIQIWLRWTLPRVRVDQLMLICWKYLIPLAFFNLFGAGLWALTSIWWVHAALYVVIAAIMAIEFIKGLKGKTATAGVIVDRPIPTGTRGQSTS